MWPSNGLSSLLAFLNIGGLNSLASPSIPAGTGVQTTADLPSSSVSTQFHLQLDLTKSLRRSIRKRQLTSFVNTGGLCSSCQVATVFTLVGDQLYADGKLITTSEDTKYQPLIGCSSTASIDSGFSVSDGILTWRHESFQADAALFCVSQAATILVIFDPSSVPDGCVPVNLIYSPYVQCSSTTINVNININIGGDSYSTPSGEVSGSGGGSSWSSPEPGPQPGSQPGSAPGSQPDPAYPSYPGGSSSGSSGASSGGYQGNSPGSYPGSGSGTSGGDSGGSSGSYPSTSSGSSSGSNSGSSSGQGQPGPAGPAGPAGSAGINGVNGVNGINGVNGSNGINGTNGTNGGDGADGRDGENGANGSDGENGENGNDGINGTDGSNGRNGTNGVNGVNGTNGRNGTNGVNGIDGVDGVNGTNANGTTLDGYVEHYGYIGCYVANPDNNFGFAPSVAQEVLTTSVDDCATFCVTQPTGQTIYFTLATNSGGDSICTCGNDLSSFNYLSVGVNFQCNIPCNFTTATTSICGGQFGELPLVSVFGAI